MIDIENDVINTVSKALHAAYSKILVVGEYVQTPAEIPCVSIVEIDNRIVENMRTLTIENAASVTFEVNVYSNKVAGNKEEAKAITASVDSEFEKMGFTRTMKNQVANLNNSKIYRIVCRYSAIVDKDLWIYHN